MQQLEDLEEFHKYKDLRYLVEKCGLLSQGLADHLDGQENKLRNGDYGIDMPFDHFCVRYGPRTMSTSMLTEMAAMVVNDVLENGVSIKTSSEYDESVRKIDFFTSRNIPIQTKTTRIERGMFYAYDSWFEGEALRLCMVDPETCQVIMGDLGMIKRIAESFGTPYFFEDKDKWGNTKKGIKYNFIPLARLTNNRDKVYDLFKYLEAMCNGKKPSF